MKKLFFITMIIIVVPFILYNFLFISKEINFNFINNTFVRIKRENKNKIEIVPLEEYVVGVVAGEMPISFHEEALKAQALAARTYVLKKIEQNNNNDYDVVDTISNQVYLDNEQLKNKWQSKYIENINKIRKAVFETQGEYITYNGEVITAFFFSTSVGKTENSEDIFVSALPYLRSVDSNWDSKTSPVFNEQNKFSLNDFCSLLNINCDSTINYEIIDTTSTGRIKKIKINNRIFTGQEVAKKLSLRSSFFTIKQNGMDIFVTTRGYGHGVGMSQYGALGMANDGYKYDEIIKYYYKGVEISKK